MSKRIKAKAQTFTVNSQDEALAFVKITEIKQNLGHGIEPLSAEIIARHEAVQAYAETNRDELTKGGKVKSIKYTTGEIGWRKRPPSVAVRAADAVIETLKKLGFHEFIRIKEEVNKEAILAEPDKAKGIAGLTINKGEEEFFIEPSDSDGTIEGAVV